MENSEKSDRLTVSYFPFKPGGNPYQTLFAGALEASGCHVVRVPPRKYFPLSHAASFRSDILQLDWPHDWYSGRNAVTRGLKRAMYEFGLAKLAKKPSVWTAHNLVAHDAKDPDYEQRMIQKLIGASDGIIVMSESARSQLYSLYDIDTNTVVEIIPHGHYIDVYPNSLTRDEARRSLNVENADKVVVSLGRLLPYKGIEKLIEAFGELNRSGSTLLIAGYCHSDGYLNTLESLARQYSKDKVKIVIEPGFVADNDLQAYFNAADIVALPFNKILNSGSLLLAMSFGKCVVAPDIGSIAEVACNDGWFEYDSDSRESLALALASAMDLPSEERELREKKVLSFTEASYSWQRTADKVAAMYSSILTDYKN